MNLSPKWVDYLTGEGFEAAHWSDVGPPDAADEAIARWAAAGNYVVLTSDLDFGALLAATRRPGPREPLKNVASGRLAVAAGAQEAECISHT